MKHKKKAAMERLDQFQNLISQALGKDLKQLFCGMPASYIKLVSKYVRQCTLRKSLNIAIK